MSLIWSSGTSSILLRLFFFCFAQKPPPSPTEQQTQQQPHWQPYIAFVNPNLSLPKHLGREALFLSRARRQSLRAGGRPSIKVETTSTYHLTRFSHISNVLINIRSFYFIVFFSGLLSISSILMIWLNLLCLPPRPPHTQAKHIAQIIFIYCVKEPFDVMNMKYMF